MSSPRVSEYAMRSEYKRRVVSRTVALDRLGICDRYMLLNQRFLPQMSVPCSSHPSPPQSVGK